jgi:hypothetical protein
MPNGYTYGRILWVPELHKFFTITTNRISASTDGTTWTNYAPVGLTGNNIQGVCWSPELHMFCIVGSAGDNKILISTDSITWTIVGSNITYPLLSVCWSPELHKFCAVSMTGGYAVSSDGINWINGTLDGSWYSICWSPELHMFCAVG